MSKKRSKSATRAYEARRRAQLERKHTEREAAKRQRNFTVLVTVGGLAVTALIVWAVVTLLNNGADEDAFNDLSQYSPTDQTPGSTSDTPEAGDAADSGGSSGGTMVPDPSLAESRVWNATLSTNQGDIQLELDGVNAPQAVANFLALADEGFFNHTDCHRLTTAGIFVLQCGDPSGDGTGGPGYRFGPIEAAPADDVYPAGTLAMARVGGDANSMGSQFFIVYEDSTIPSDVAGGYTVFGHVTAGLSIVEDVASAGTITGQPDGRPAQSVIVNEVSAS